jgi:Flp pilus assembly protein TadD
MGAALLERGEVSEAVSHYRQALILHPGSPEVANNLAWLLATSDDDSVRDPAQALRLAQHSLELADSEDPALLDTLAAAHANRGRYKRAVRIIHKALEAESLDKDPELAAEMRLRLKLYEARQPYRESPVRPRSLADVDEVTGSERAGSAPSSFLD